MKTIKRIFLVYVGYVAVIVMLVTPLANYFLPKIYQQQTGRHLHTVGVGINPFTLTFFLYHTEDKNPDGSVLWSVDELAINLSLASLLGQGVVLDALSVKSLYLHPQKKPDGHWIFDDILAHRAALPQPEAAEVAAEDTGLPGVTVHAIHFNAKYLGYSDHARAEPFESALEDITISLQDFSTLVEEGRPYHFIAKDESGGELEWQGTLSIPGKRSEGQLYLRKISLLPVWRFIQSDVNFKMHSAFLNVGGQYSVSWEDPANLRYRIEKARVALTDIDITPKQERESGLQLAECSLNNITVDSVKKRFESSLLHIKSFRGTVSILQDGSMNFQSMFKSKTKAEKETATAESEPWQARIDVIRLEDAAFIFNDYSINPDFTVKIQDFGGDIKPFSTDKKNVMAIDLKGSVDGYAPVTLTGSVRPMASPLDLKVAFNFRGIELTSFAPYSGTYAGYKIDSGLLTVSLAYLLKNNRMQGRNKVVINQLALGERVKSPRLIDLPLRLALALLTDEHGVIDLDVEVSGNTNNPDFSIGKIVLQAFRNLIVKAATAPFRLLADLVGGGDFEFIAFEPGQSMLDDTAKQSLGKLKEALAKRPQLNLGLNGQHSDIDREYFEKLVQKKKMKAEAVPVELEKLTDARAMAVKLYLLQESGMDAARVYIDKAVGKDNRPAVKLLLEPR